MRRLPRHLIAVAVLAAACGNASSTTTTTTSAPTTSPPDTQATTAAPPTTTSSPTTTTTEATEAASTTIPPPSSAEPLRSYRFRIAVALVADPGDIPGDPIHQLSGEFTTDPMAMRIFGDFRDEQLDLVTDGTTWWDLDDLDLDIGAEDIQFFLGANGFLLPEWAEELFESDMAWDFVGPDVLGVPTSRSRRVNIIGGVDWELGDLAQMDIWRDDLGQLMKFQAWFATGDNTGFPVSIWEITDRNPEITIQLPDR